MAWRSRTLGDGWLGRILLPNDMPAVAFRAACIAALVIAVIREIAIVP
jgi:hypothetical protein